MKFLVLLAVLFVAYLVWRGKRVEKIHRARKPVFARAAGHAGLCALRCPRATR